MLRAELPSLRHLRTFEAVARLASLGRAAIELRRSQPAVTQGLATLERLLDVLLLERRHMGSFVTDAGRILQMRVQRLLVQLDQALELAAATGTSADRARPLPRHANITSTLVRSIVATAETGSVELAAHQLGVLVASLHRSLRGLEQICGCRLMQQTAHGVTLTQAGLELARRLRLAMGEIDYAREEIAAARGRAQTQISIGAIPQCATAVLAAAVDELLRREPGAQVRIADGPYDALLNELRTGRVDFLFGVLRKPAWAADVVEEALFADPYAILVRNGHPLSRARNLRLDDLAAFDWIVPRPGTPRRRSFERLFEGLSRKPASNVETSALEVQVALIAASDRITLISMQEARRVVRGGDVVVLDYRPRIARSHDGVATRADWHPTAGQLAFLEILREKADRLSPVRPTPRKGPHHGSGRAPIARIDRRA